MTENTFRADDIRQIQPYFTDDEVEHAFRIFEHMGLIRKAIENGKVVYYRTEKGKNFQPDRVTGMESTD